MSLSGGRVELSSARRKTRHVVLRFPQVPEVVDAVGGLPGVRFDWEARHWLMPLRAESIPHVTRLLARFPETETTAEVDEWLGRDQDRWVGTVGVARHEGSGYWRLETAAGSLPPTLLGDELVPIDAESARALRELPGAVLDAYAKATLDEVSRKGSAPAARVEPGPDTIIGSLRLSVFWDPGLDAAWRRLPGARDRELTLDPFGLANLDDFVASPDVEVAPAAGVRIDRVRAEHEAFARVVRSSLATEAEPLADVRLNGQLRPFQWGAVRYALRARQCFIADEQGLGKTVEALATLEAAGAFPALVICPASLRLNWLREAGRWLPHRSEAVLRGGIDSVSLPDIAIASYEHVAAHHPKLGLGGLVIDESHYVKNPRANRTKGVLAIAAALPPDAIRLALTGTPVINHARELVPQLRVLGRLSDFGSGAAFLRWLDQSDHARQRLHWRLRGACYVRRLKRDVLDQLPEKQRVSVPIALDDEQEYRLAERSVIDWLRAQPLTLDELEARVASTRRAERLAQLAALQRLAARGKLRGAIEWIESFLASDEPLVVFVRHREIGRALVKRFPGALHVFGEDSEQARDAAVRAFQDPDGPQLIVCSIQAAGHGLTLTKASNVCFVELAWTSAAHDQAEDRCHRIGQRAAVTAWYLLAAGTIDERIVRLVERKRAHVAEVTEGGALGASVLDDLLAELRGGDSERNP